MGAFFYGYLLLQLPGGILSQSIGSKVVISVGMGTVAIMTLLSPVFARINPYGLFAVRVIIGLGQVRLATNSSFEMLHCSLLTVRAVMRSVASLISNMRFADSTQIG